MVQMPDVRWDDVGGVDEARDKLREGVELPLKNAAAFHRLGIRPAKGFLLFGPPGTGKTLLAKAVARESEANFITVKSSDLLSKWYGESEQQIARLRSEEHTSELQSLMRISYAVFCLKKKKKKKRK